MKFRNFIIKNYRAIEYAELSLNNPLTPLIGINESGKSSVLYALLAFDKLQDKLDDGKHLDYTNKYKTGKQQIPCHIHAEILFESIDEINSISKQLELSPGNDLHETMKRFLENKKTIVVSRNLETKEYKIETEEIPVTTNQNKDLANSILERTPLILYFKGFDEAIGDKIDFPTQHDYSKKDTTTSKSEWRNLLSEIFKQTTDHSLKEFVELPAKSLDEGNVLRILNEKLDKQIIQTWENLRKEGLTTGVKRISNLKLNINHYVNSDKSHEFHLGIIDTSADDGGKGFTIKDRSVGLNWFFNFIVKLNYNPHYRGEKPEEAIYLLDEPGSNLHSSAQEGLLKILKKFSERNFIIYGTHSENLLNPELINVNAIKIVEKDSKVLVKSFPQAGIRKDEGAFTPLYRALHLKSGVRMFQSIKVVITEGLTDYYFFKMLIEHTDLVTAKDLQFVPGEGADQLNTLISLAIGSCDKYLVLLDSDKKGRDAYDNYSKSFGEFQSKNFFKYISPNKNENFQLEDFLSTDDRGRLKEITGVEDLKDAIVSLYWHKDKAMIPHFFQKLFPETIENLKIVLAMINKL